MACSHSLLILKFCNLQIVGLLGWGIRLVARPLPTQDNTNTEENQPDIHASTGVQNHGPVFEEAKTFHALNRAEFDKR
jgi:hypothetical protein